jgi:hypothetical protein
MNNTEEFYWEITFSSRLSFNLNGLGSHLERRGIFTKYRRKDDCRFTETLFKKEVIKNEEHLLIKQENGEPYLIKSYIDNGYFDERSYERIIKITIYVNSTFSVNVLPPIVLLIEDYLKLNCGTDIVIETLNKTQKEQIEAIGRNVSPMTLLKQLRKAEITNSTPCPERIYFSGYGHQSDAIFFGDNKTFENISHFWLSFIAWVYMDSIHDFNGVETGYLGLCFPIHPDNEEVKPIITSILSLNHTTSKLEDCYQMSKGGDEEWDNRKYLFDFGDCYFVYNWYTGE